MRAEESRKSMEKLTRRRKRLQPVKLEYQGKLSDTVRDSLANLFGHGPEGVYIGGVLRYPPGGKQLRFVPEDIPHSAHKGQVQGNMTQVGTGNYNETFS